ncbi:MULTISPECIES: methylisocitrate lyase [Brevibacterium]|uniref:Methylisocitrate lyase n=1 Tax=Brevibacterium ravenspurgense TaxID=479117 RepID=A0A150H8U4_9MICO|nr:MULTISPECIES: methylisocitrate lyase [Brevibacterium]KXZ58519.1 Methylisocitrate lyase [Brevibacterium ravenspurgense]MCG7300327.1 methylisocitrate lyase [Brevibacterium ravenspurgense]OFT99066.1 methylisocitrate lyase [Brevibacterium sp. HMSC22B09]
MLGATTPAHKRREEFRRLLAGDKIVQFPGAINPINAQIIEQEGFEGVYISGGAFSADQGLPDIGLTTLTEVAEHGRAISRVTNLPTFIDADTGWGEAMNVARTVQEMEDAGIAGMHLEDQVNPKRCGHLDGKEIVSTEEMVKRISAAVRGRRDENFVLCARTDARAGEGLDAAIDRAKAYIDAGADLIFPEAMRDLGEFEKFAKAVDAPILANMTEFGKSELFTTQQLESAGVKLVIYPVTTLRLAMGAIKRGLQVIRKEGTQESLVSTMQTRADLYETIDYSAYNEFDAHVFNFSQEGHQ